MHSLENTEFHLGKHFQPINLGETNSEFAPENGWLEYDEVSFWGKRPIFRGELLVSGRVNLVGQKNSGKKTMTTLRFSENQESETVSFR